MHVSCGSTIYTPAFPRGGAIGEFAVLVPRGNGGLVMNVWHRNQDEDTWQAVKDAEAALHGPGVCCVVGRRLKELVRIRFSVEFGGHADVLIEKPCWTEEE